MTLPSQATATVSLDQATGKRRRMFSELHADVWRIVVSAPTIFVLLPMFVWFPFDWAIESITLARGGDLFEQVRFSMRFTNAASLVIGTFVTSAHLVALLAIGRGQPVTLGGVLAEAMRFWPRVIKATLSVYWRVMLAFLLLILPGIYVSLQYALVIPMLALERASTREALDLSAAHMEGSFGRVGGGLLLAALIYFPFAFALLLVIPSSPNALQSALSFIPINVLVSFTTIALFLIAVDKLGGEEMSAPVGATAWQAGFDDQRLHSSNRRFVACVSAVSATLLIGGGWAFYSFAIEPTNIGDAAYAEGRFEDAIASYERVLDWDESDAYIQWSLGWAHFELEHFAEAVEYFASAARIDPTDPDYLLDHARALAVVGATESAKGQLERARKRGASSEALGSVEALLP